MHLVFFPHIFLKSSNIIFHNSVYENPHIPTRVTLKIHFPVHVTIPHFTLKPFFKREERRLNEGLNTLIEMPYYFFNC